MFRTPEQRRAMGVAVAVLAAVDGDTWREWRECGESGEGFCGCCVQNLYDARDTVENRLARASVVAVVDMSGPDTVIHWTDGRETVLPAARRPT